MMKKGLFGGLYSLLKRHAWVFCFSTVFVFLLLNAPWLRQNQNNFLSPSVGISSIPEYPLRFRVVTDKEMVGSMAADRIEEIMLREEAPVFVFPFGNTPIPLCQELVRRAEAGRIDFRNTTIFMLDTTLGLNDAEEFIQKNLLAPLVKQNLPIPRVECLKGKAENPEQELQRYQQLLVEIPKIHLMLLGIGGNGHFAYNEPGASLSASLRRILLHPRTKKDNFGDENLPMEGLTIGPQEMLSADEVILMAIGEGKAEIIERLWREEPNGQLTATYLKFHPNARVIVDQAAASRLPADVRERAASPVRVVLLGHGNIGSAVRRTFEDPEIKALAYRELEMEIEIVMIADGREAVGKGLRSGLFTTNTRDVLGVKSDGLIEVTAGTTAWPTVEEWFVNGGNGKILVTSNKELVATNLPFLFELADESNAILGLETTVGGANVEIEMLEEEFHPWEVNAVYGIFNGTTNLMLTLMAEKVLKAHQEGMDLNMDELFQSALEKAIAGKATEPNHLNDTTGKDAAFKASILAAVGFREYIEPGTFYTEGLVGQDSTLDRNHFLLGPEDFVGADQLGYVLRLVGRIVRMPDGRLDQRVHLALVPKEHPIAETRNLDNIFFIQDQQGRRVMSPRLPGAGPEPTAHAIAKDVIRAKKRQQTGIVPDYELHKGTVLPIQETEQPYYVTIEINLQPNVTAVQVLSEAVPSDFIGSRLVEINASHAGWITPRMEEEQMNQFLESLRLDPRIKTIRRIRVFEDPPLISPRLTESAVGHGI